MKYILSVLLLYFPFSLALWGIDDFPVSEDNFAETFSEQLPSVASDSNGNFVVVWMDEREGDYAIYGQRFTSEGLPIGANFRISQFTTEENAAPAIAMNAEGKFVITWVQGDDIYARLFDENGNPISSAFKINDDIAHMHASPSVTFLDIGMFVITWQDTRNGTWAPDIFGQLYFGDGTPFLSNFIVNDHTGGEQGFPSVSISEFEETYTITWMDKRNGNFDIYAQSFLLDYTIGSNKRVDDDTTEADQYTPVICQNLIVWQDYREGYPSIYASRVDLSNPVGVNFRVNDDVDTMWRGNPSVSSIFNGYIVVWVDERNGNLDIYAQMFDANTNPIGSNFQVNTGTDTLAQSFPFVTGNISDAVVAFQDEKIGECDVYFQRYDSAGVSQGPNTIVTNNLFGAHQIFSAISIPYNGEFVVIWQDLREYNWDIFIQRIDTSGSLLSNNILVNDDLLSNEQILPSIAKDTSGNFVSVWMDSRDNNWDIYGEVFDAYGNSIGNNFRINEDTLKNDQFFPDCEKNINGGFIVTWNDLNNILARKYDDNGNPLGNSFKVNDDTIPGFCPSITISHNGSFLITYTAGWHIYASMFDSFAIPARPTFRVDDDSTLSEKFSPDIRIDESGDFVITWEDLRNTEPDIYAQRFDSSGNPIESNFKVSDNGWGTEQYLPSVAVSPQGKFVIAWIDDRDGDLNIYAQRYLSDGSSYGQNFKVNNDIGLCQHTDVDVSIDNEGKMFFSWTDRRKGVSGTDIFVKIVRFETGVQSENIPWAKNKMLILEICPNPFSNKLEIRLNIAEIAKMKKRVSLCIYDLSGRLIKTFSLKSGDFSPTTTLSWNGKDDKGKMVSVGVYFAKFTQGNVTATKKIVKMK